jgi:prefoldin subunit 5
MSLSPRRAIADQAKRLDDQVKQLAAENGQLRASRARLLGCLRGIRELAEADLRAGEVPGTSGLWQIEADARVAIEREAGGVDA